ncbi:hypothetical protein DPMN_038151 [Dreissena polymorpha]|uniref:Uncharacterized protein n=1 Tax=Dreissena polymorpha TaxID=45954 RepID=A0A9D4MCL0_DREPO|nr:hypothetical protein DPMN_038151 [Dreissena polymorpha]
MNHSPSTVRLIVKTCCILHNLMRIRYPVMTMMIEEPIWSLGNGEEVATWRIPGMSISGATTQQSKRQDCEKHSEALDQLSSGMCEIARQDGATLEIEIKCNTLVE